MRSQLIAKRAALSAAPAHAYFIRKSLSSQSLLTTQNARRACTKGSVSSLCYKARMGRNLRLHSHPSRIEYWRHLVAIAAYSTAAAGLSPCSSTTVNVDVENPHRCDGLAEIFQLQVPVNRRQRSVCPHRTKKSVRQRRTRHLSGVLNLERAAGIEPATLAWKARALPLCNARTRVPVRIFYRTALHTVDVVDEKRAPVKPQRVDREPWAGQDSNLRSALARWIYSPMPLTTRPPTHDGSPHSTPRR